MTDHDDAATEPQPQEPPSSVPPLPVVRIRAVLDGSVTDGTRIVVHGTLVAVTVKVHEQSGPWASGRLVDDDDAIEFLMFPRAFARTDRSCLDSADPVAVTARASISTERTALVVDQMVRIDDAAV